jgi:hypothetical protein
MTHQQQAHIMEESAMFGLEFNKSSRQRMSALLTALESSLGYSPTSQDNGERVITALSTLQGKLETLAHLGDTLEKSGR